MNAISAGLFGEGVRFGIFNKKRGVIKTVKHALCFGLGWGLREALLIFVISTLVQGIFYELLITINPMPSESALIFSFILNGFERNITILFHTSLTMLVALAVWHRKFFFVLVAIMIHFLFDFIPIMILEFILYQTLDTFIARIVTQCVFAVFSAVTFIVAFKFLKQEVGPSVFKDK
ncbi:MAG: YhfC family glutamic-type intramembrane protease [Candidatus Ranarchaeia archaeon]